MMIVAIMMATVLLASSVNARRNSNGCSNPGSGTIGRPTRVVLPNGYEEEMEDERPRGFPLVLMFHGWGEDENAFLQRGEVRREIRRRGFIGAAARGLGEGSPDESYNSWNNFGSNTGIDGNGGSICDVAVNTDYGYATCKAGADPIAENVCSWTHCQGDDFQFVNDWVEYMGNKFCVDLDNVFIFGGSNGGMFVWSLTADERTSHLFRGATSLIGLPHRGYVTGGHVPTLLITGTNDPTVPPGPWDSYADTQTSDGDAYYYTSATAITNAYARQQGCAGVDSNAAPWTIPGNRRFSKATCRTFCTDEDDDYIDDYPRVIDCRAEMAHSYALGWSFDLAMQFFDGIKK